MTTKTEPADPVEFPPTPRLRKGERPPRLWLERLEPRRQVVIFMLADQKELYSVSKWEIFSRNFLVGMSRALGALFIQILGLALISFLFLRFFAPTLSPLMSTFGDAVDQLKALQQNPAFKDPSTNSNQQMTIPESLLEQFGRGETPTTR